jgi:hypothetical protein
MKLTIKLFLIVCLFSSVAFADEGNMGNGGLADGHQTNGGKTEGNQGTGGFADGDMGNDGKTEGHQGNGGRTVNNTSQNDSVLTFIQEYLISLFG